MILRAVLAALLFAAPALAQTTNVLTPAEQKEGWKLLFDGKTLSGWAPQGAAKWEVQNGELVAKGGGHLLTTRQYGDFHLRLDFWSEGNSGVFIRAPETGVIDTTTAFEVNINDKSEWPTGSVAPVVKVTTVPNTIGKWHTYDISADGDHIVVLLNGEKTADFHSMMLARGVISLQYAATPGPTVKFRNIRLREN